MHDNRPACYRIVGYWSSGEPFLVCMGRTPNECRWSIQVATEHLYLGDLQWFKRAALEQWIPSMRRPNRGHWDEVCELTEVVADIVRRNSADRVLSAEPMVEYGVVLSGAKSG